MTRELATRRALQLAEDLANEERFGSLAAVERYWGMGSGYMSRLRTETERNIGEGAMRKIRARMGIRAEFFTDASLGDRPDYRAFTGAGPAADSRVELDHEDTPAWRELVELGWLDRYRRRGLSEAQIEYARRTLFRGAPSVDDYVDVLEAMVRALQRPEAPEMAAARAKNEREGVPSAKHWVPKPPGANGSVEKRRSKAKKSRR